MSLKKHIPVKESNNNARIKYCTSNPCEHYCVDCCCLALNKLIIICLGNLDTYFVE